MLGEHCSCSIVFLTGHSSSAPRVIRTLVLCPRHNATMWPVGMSGTSSLFFDRLSTDRESTGHLMKFISDNESIRLNISMYNLSPHKRNVLNMLNVFSWTINGLNLTI